MGQKSLCVQWFYWRQWKILGEIFRTFSRKHWTIFMFITSNRRTKDWHLYHKLMFVWRMFTRILFWLDDSSVSFSSSKLKFTVKKGTRFTNLFLAIAKFSGDCNCNCWILFCTRKTYWFRRPKWRVVIGVTHNLSITPSPSAMKPSKKFAILKPNLFRTRWSFFSDLHSS